MRFNKIFKTVCLQGHRRRRRRRRSFYFSCALSLISYIHYKSDDTSGPYHVHKSHLGSSRVRHTNTWSIVNRCNRWWQRVTHINLIKQPFCIIIFTISTLEKVSFQINFDTWLVECYFDFLVWVRLCGLVGCWLERQSGRQGN